MQGHYTANNSVLSAYAHELWLTVPLIMGYGPAVN